MTYYFAQNATIEVREPNTARFKVVGAAQEVSIDTEFEVEELYQFGSILRTTAARHHASINVKVSTAQFGAFATDPAWFWRILNAAGVTEHEFNQQASTSSKAKAITISDTTNLPMFSIAGEWTSDDGSETIYGRVDGVYFKGFSWGGALGEYIIEELEGTGSQVLFTVDKDYAAGGSATDLWSGTVARISTSLEAIRTTTSPATFKVLKGNQYTSLTALAQNVLDDGKTTGLATAEISIGSTADSDGNITITVTFEEGTTQTTGAIFNVYVIADGLSKIIPVEFYGITS